MTVTSLMGVGTQALFAAYRQVHTVGNNIANANTEGYSRQHVVQESGMSLRTTGGWVGTGVTIASVNRASNQFLTNQATSLTATAAADASRSGMLDQLELVFKTGEAGLGNSATQLFGAFADLTVNPADLSARQAVMGRLQEFTALANASGTQLQALVDNVRSDISGAVNEVNEMARQLAGMNVQIQNSSARGVAPNDLLDKRDVLVKRLAEQLDVQAYTYADGTMAVFAAGGQPLVLGAEANALVMSRDQLDPSRVSVSVNVQGELTLLSDSHIEGGRIGGLLRFQNSDLIDARNGLGQMVAGVALALNQQQAWGKSLYNEAAGTLPPPLFAVPEPQLLAATTNARDALGQPLTSMTAEVSDPGALKASDYEVMADPASPGTYLVTRLSDRTQFSNVASGDVVDGLRLLNGANVPTPGERFLMRGVAHTAVGLRSVLEDPKGLAAAGPVVAQLGVGNKGSLSISAVDIVATPPAAGHQAMTVRFTDDSGAFELLNDVGAFMGSGSFTPGQPLEVEGIALNLGGVPRTGDRVQINPTTFAKSNNGNAQTFARLGERLLVDGQIVAEAYASLMSDMGVRAQGAAIAADNSGAAATRADEALSAETGVNVDEEAARLIQYQQSYQAAAKVLQTAQTMIDTVLGLTR